MVRLKNPMAGAGSGPPVPAPAVDDDPTLLARLDAALREDVRTALADVRGRVLVVGAQWPELALELAATGRFVTLLEPRVERLGPVRDEVLARNLTQRVTLDTRSYADVSYEAGAFEAIVLYDPFAYLGAPEPLFNKCRRELRAGGQLLVRVVVSAGAPYPEAPPQSVGLTARPVEIPPDEGRLHALLGVRDELVGRLYGLLRLAGLLDPQARVRYDGGALGHPERRGPTFTALEEAIGRHFVLTGVRAYHLASFELAELACSLRAPLDRLAAALLGPAQRLDAQLLTRPAFRRFAPTVLVQATKLRELGRVFVVPR